jgi:hypothetical protein
LPIQITETVLAASALPFGELEDRANTLSVCMVVAADHTTAPDSEYYREIDKYYRLGNAYETSNIARLRHYITRHDEFDRFLAEDAAGKR